jgi:hypothetical protein
VVAGESGETMVSVSSGPSFPPIAELAIGSMAIIVVGGIYLASYVPRTVPLFPAVVLLALSVALLGMNLVTLSRLRRFAWHRFFQVFSWTLLAYSVIAGMIGYAFVTDGTRGSVLAVLLLMLVVFAIDIPLLLAFSVARYDEPGA